MSRIFPLLLLAGCGDPVEKKWRRALDGGGPLTMLGWEMTGDGANCFSFSLEAGGAFVVKAPRPGGGSQELRLLGDGIPGETEIPPGSDLEILLVGLLENCRFTKEFYIAQPPSPAARNWLLERLKNRAMPWAPVP